MLYIFTVLPKILVLIALCLLQVFLQRVVKRPASMLQVRRKLQVNLNHQLTDFVSIIN